MLWPILALVIAAAEQGAYSEKAFVAGSAFAYAEWAEVACGIPVSADLQGLASELARLDPEAYDEGRQTGHQQISLDVRELGVDAVCEDLR